MTPEAQRIAIAEACGWTEISDWGAGGINGKHPTEPWTEVIPDYLNDLNAMREAWRTLPPSQKDRFESELYSVVIGQADYNRNDDAPYITNATAAQRAEAFLRTIGKWTTN